MLGRLLSTARSSPSPKLPVNDEAEDAHTRALLYQGNNTVSTCNCADNDGQGCIRDVRVIIAQDSVNGEPKLTIYDSVPIAQSQSFIPRKADAPAHPTSGTPRNRRRSGARLSVSGIQFTPNTGLEDERKVLQECMFGSSIMAYKGPSTKVHVLPSAPQTTTAAHTTSTSAPNTLRRNSLKAPAMGHISASTQDLTFGSNNSSEDIKSVLITRTFNVILPSTSAGNSTSQHQQHHVSFKVPSREDAPVTPGSSVGSTHGFPFPTMNSKAGTPPSALKAVKPPKTINYAIGLIISIPNNSVHQTSNAAHVPTNTRHGRLSGDIEFIDPLATIRRPNQAPLPDELAENLVDNRMDLVTKNWDIITRTLNELQIVATQRITATLNAKTIILSPATYGPQRKTSLDTASLMNDNVIRDEVERQRWRITTGLQIPRVITGQGRWSEWRDEAKWAGTTFGGRDRNFFFLALLTAFLGHHPDWLDVLAPPAYRRRHVQKQRTLGKEDAYLPSRTVVVCDNKFVSRRLVYLLAAFLPERSSPTTHWAGDYTSSNRSTVSDDGLGRSPPSKGPEFKREIRRVPSKLSMVEGVDESDNSNLTSTWDVPRVSHGDDKDKTPSRVGTSLPTHFGTSQLPIPFSAPRKAPSTTTTDSMVPHAANLSSSFKREHPEPRPGSSGSSVSVSLMQTLRRSGSNNTSGNTNESSGGTNVSGWGSFLSSIWSSPRSRGSPSVASSLASTVADDTNAENGNFRRTGTGLSDNVYDDEHHGYPSMYDVQEDSIRPLAFSPPTHWHQDGIRTPGFEESTLRYSVDDDGIIDVDIPMGLPAVQPTFDMGGLGALGSSPLPSSPTSTNAAESSMENSLISLSALTLLPPFPQATGESDTTGNVAAELDRFHPDFILQAVKPYKELEMDVRRGMLSEPTPAFVPTPSNENGREEAKWIDICSTLIADTTTMKIKRLTLRRKKRPTPLFSQHLMPSQLVSHSFMRDEHDKEEFVEEDVMDMEELLVSAVEKVIADPPAKATVPSRAASVKSPKTRPQNPRRRTDVLDIKTIDHDTRKVVLGSLEDVVRKVADDRKALVENILTEGVAKWLNELEDAGAV
ncbi:hypothetical protein H072_8225 [Dactylellina haptotyla CBS 200.50]|uniref:Folliculin-interacting protein N-terminal domain-containing protein n=1 Tax=Dactylellina haptotyla (strain CBS 200.50) TaxID=1284197 RepID=S8AAC3_DACHA|nr:hypothetical protein H072_8225 [Dactylellina haptotyla CBS 200.50]